VDKQRTTFIELLEKCRAGDADAMAALYARYNEVIRQAVRRRLPDRMRQEFDSLDFAQDVWASFCALPVGPDRFQSRQELQAFLTRVAYNKVTDTYRRRIAGKGHAVSKEIPLFPLPSPEATPSQWAIAGERWNEIADTLPPLDLAIVKRLREGYSHQEVAEMASVSVRTVGRILQRVHRLCEEKP
jgi:RNA polymerase sigma factor (sigma-70 family)